MKFNPIIYVLLRIGLVAYNGKKIVYPFNGPPEWMYRECRDRKTLKPLWFWMRWHGFPKPYIFRNTHCNPRFVEGRLLPWRWGFGIGGFEFGDRGSSIKQPFAS